MVVGALPQPPHIRFSSPGKRLFHHPARAGPRDLRSTEGSVGAVNTCPRVPPGRTHLPSAAHLPSRRTSGRCGGLCQGVLGRDGVRHSAGRPHTRPPGRTHLPSTAHLPSRRTHLPRAQVLGRDDVAGGARGCWVDRPYSQRTPACMVSEGRFACPDGFPGPTASTQSAPKILGMDTAALAPPPWCPRVRPPTDRIPRPEQPWYP